MGQLPFYPALRPYLRPGLIDDTHVTFQGGTRQVTLSGRSAGGILPSLLPLLDGSRQLDDIVRELPWIEDTVIVEVLKMLNDQRLLEDADLTRNNGYSDHQLNPLRCQTNYWLSISDDRYSLQSTLFNAHIVILGTGPLGHRVAASLASTGIGTLTLVDLAQKHRHQPSIPHGLPGSRASAISTELMAIHTDLTCRPLEDIDTLEIPEVRSALLGADMLVACGEDDSSFDWDMINEFSIAESIPWIRTLVQHHEIQLGPLVIPRQSACFTCFSLRLQSNMPDEVSTTSAIPLNGHSVEPAFLNATIELAGSLLALEITRFLTNTGQSRAVGALLRFDALTSELNRHGVLKLPRCPACGPSFVQPRIKIWDIQTSTTEKVP